MDLRQLRTEVDSIDEEILALLNRRMEFTLRTRKLKTVVEEPQREQEIIARIRTRSSRLISPEFSERLFMEIIGESKRLQSEKRTLIGFQGEHGAFSEMAIRSVYPDAVPIPHGDFRSVFEGLHNGVLDRGVVPVENSVAGNVVEVDDLLINSELKILGEITCPISHCLLALPGSDHRDIRVVYSHPQALAQCRGFLTRNRLEGRSYYNTAGAALMLAREKPAASAVLASKLSAELYGLEILKDNVQDSSQNSTRFLLLGRESEADNGTKCSVVFSTKHKPGALFQILRVFSETGINLTRIESRPAAGDPGSFAFLLDFQGNQNNPAVTNALELLGQEASAVKFLGCYGELTSQGSDLS